MVLPGEIIEILQDDDMSWLTLFYSLPKELVEKYPPAMKIPRCPYEVLREGACANIVKGEMMKLLVWDSYSWIAWQFFKVKDRHGIIVKFPAAVSITQGVFRSGDCPTQSFPTSV